MVHDDVWQALKASVLEVLPERKEHNLQPQESLRDLGANSVDRAEIIMLTMARLRVKISLVEFAQTKNMQGLIDIFLAKVSA